MYYGNSLYNELVNNLTKVVCIGTSTNLLNYINDFSSLSDYVADPNLSDWYLELNTLDNDNTIIGSNESNIVFTYNNNVNNHYVYNSIIINYVLLSDTNNNVLGLYYLESNWNSQDLIFNELSITLRITNTTLSTSNADVTIDYSNHLSSDNITHKIKFNTENQLINVDNIRESNENRVTNSYNQMIRTSLDTRTNEINPDDQSIKFDNDSSTKLNAILSHNKGHVGSFISKYTDDDNYYCYQGGDNDLSSIDDYKTYDRNLIKYSNNQENLDIETKLIESGNQEILELCDINNNSKGSITLNYNEHLEYFDKNIAIVRNDNTTPISHRVYNTEINHTTNYLNFSCESGSFRLTLNRVGSPQSISLKYSFDCINWYSLTIGSTISNITKIYIRTETPTNYFSTDESNYYKFSISPQSGTKVYCNGSIRSLIDPTNTRSTIPNNYCFYRLLDSCPIWSAPELPFTELTVGCYKNMLSSTNIIIQPDLPSKLTASECYSHLFYRCENLLVAKDLPSAVVGKNAYLSMYEGCNSLIKTSRMLATRILDSGCSRMYKDCISLIKCEELLFTEIGDGGCDSMYEGCTSLVEPPTELLPTIHRSRCYARMFGDCDKLVRTPKINGNPQNTSLVEMFKGCTLLSLVITNFTQCNPSDCTDWLTGVNPYGTAVHHPNLSDLSIFPSDPTPSNAGWYKISINNWYDPLYFCITNITDLCKIQLVNIDPNACVSPVVLYYKYDLNSIGDNIFLRSVSGNIMRDSNIVIIDASNPIVYIFSGSQYPNNDYGNIYLNTDTLYRKFTTSKPVLCGGNIMSLLSRNLNPIDIPTNIPNMRYIFQHLFEGSSILTPPLLPSTTTSYGCYSEMFTGCTELLGLPNINAYSLAPNSCESMFSGISSSNLSALSYISATSLNTRCCESMFKETIDRSTRELISMYLPGLNLVNDCYKTIFYGDILNWLQVDFINSFNQDYTEYWLGGDADAVTNLVRTGINDVNDLIPPTFNDIKAVTNYFNYRNILTVGDATLILVPPKITSESDAVYTYYDDQNFSNWYSMDHVMDSLTSDTYTYILDRYQSYKFTSRNLSLLLKSLKLNSTDLITTNPDTDRISAITEGLIIFATYNATTRINRDIHGHHQIGTGFVIRTPNGRLTITHNYDRIILLTKNLFLTRRTITTQRVVWYVHEIINYSGNIKLETHTLGFHSYDKINENEFTDIFNIKDNLIMLPVDGRLLIKELDTDPDFKKPIPIIHKF